MFATRCKDRGIALVMVIVILMALIAIALPFTVSMQIQEKESRTQLYRAQARLLAEGARNLAVSQLYRTHDVYEKNGDLPAPFNTPDWDTLDEFRVDMAMSSDKNLLAKIEASLVDPVGMMWSAEVQDEQGKLNVNSASPWALGNMLGSAILVEPLSEEETRLVVDNGSAFFSDNNPSTIDGYVLLEREVISYKHVTGNTLEGCERGRLMDRMFAEPSKHKAKNLVVDFRAFKAAAYPAASAESYSPYLSLSDLKKISTLEPQGEGLTSFAPSELDRIRPMLTVHSHREIRDGWTVPVRVAKVLNQDQSGLPDVLVLWNGRNLSPGTHVRLVRKNAASEVNTDESVRTEEFAVVLWNDNTREGAFNVTLDRKLGMVFEDGDTWEAQSLKRHPVNINTASRAVLRALMVGLKSRNDMGFDNPETGEEVKPSTCVTREETDLVIDRICEFKDQSGSLSPIRCHEDLRDLLQAMVDEAVLTANSMHAILLNFRNPNDYRMVASTLPVCFKSFDTYTIEVSGIVNAPSGRQVASHRFREVVHLSPPQSASLTLESQYDFQQEIWAPQGNAVCTWPNCVSMQDVYPDYSRDPDTGDVRLMSARMWGGSNTRASAKVSGGSAFQVTLAGGQTGYVEHFDRQYIEGYEITPEGPIIDGTGFNFDAGRTKFGPDPATNNLDCKAGCIEMWFKPRFGKGTDPQVLFDQAENASLAYTNRITLFIEPESGELVFRMADGTLEPTAAEVRVPASEYLQSEVWTHLAASWKSTRYGEMSLFIDGRPRGRFVHRHESGGEQVTVLSEDLPAGAADTINVDSTDGFPPAGVIIIGREAIEYTNTTPGSFNYDPYPEFDPNATVSGADGTYTPQDPDTPSTPGAGGGSSGPTDKVSTPGGPGDPAVDRQDPVPEQEEPVNTSRDVSHGRGKRDTKSVGHPKGSAVTIFGFASPLASKIPKGGETLREEIGADTQTHVLMPWEGTTGGGGAPGGMPPSEPGSFIRDPGVLYQSPIPLPPIIVVARDATEIKVESTEGFPSKGFLLLTKFRITVTIVDPGSYTPGAGGGGSPGGVDNQEGPPPVPPSGGSSPASNEQLDLQYEMVYYGEKDDKKFMKLQRGMLGTEVQQFENRWVDVLLMSLPISAMGDYEADGRVQVDNEWFRYDHIIDMEGQLHMVRNFKEVVDSVFEAGEDNKDSATAEPEDPNNPDPNQDDPVYEEINFRGYSFRCFNRTVNKLHAASAKLIPVFKTIHKICGRFDAATIITQEGKTITQRRSAMVNWADEDYVAFTDYLDGAFEALNTRLLKFPSGETAGNLDGSVSMCASKTGEATSGVLDEVRFSTAGRGYYRLQGSIDDRTDTLTIEPPQITQAVQITVQGQGQQPQVAVTVNAVQLADSGVLKIGNEIMGYSSKADNVVSGLKRGLMGTKPSVHDDGEFVMNLSFLTVSALGESAGTEDNSLSLLSVNDFPNEGYVMVNEEMIGFSRREPGKLVIPSANPDSPGLFRGAFGTKKSPHTTGDMAVLMPFRYFDGWREKTDVPEMAYFQASFACNGAYWDRLQWEQVVPYDGHQSVLVYARIDGAPAWDAEPSNKPGGLYVFNNPAGENIIGAQGDSIEVRVYFVYKNDAFSTQAWKSTPIVRNMLVRFAQPLRVLTHEELNR